MDACRNLSNIREWLSGDLGGCSDGYIYVCPQGRKCCLSVLDFHFCAIHTALNGGRHSHSYCVKCSRKLFDGVVNWRGKNFSCLGKGHFAGRSGALLVLCVHFFCFKSPSSAGRGLFFIVINYRCKNSRNHECHYYLVHFVLWMSQREPPVWRWGTDSCYHSRVSISKVSIRGRTRTCKTFLYRTVTKSDTPRSPNLWAFLRLPIPPPGCLPHSRSGCVLSSDSGHVGV